MGRVLRLVEMGTEDPTPGTDVLEISRPSDLPIPRGPWVGTSLAEGTANFLVNRRMNKCQQMAVACAARGR
jgi:hypothetical protein